MIPNPGCNCCSCTLSSDTFSSTLDPKWTTVSGSWSIASTQLAGTGAGIIYDSTTHPDGTAGNSSIVVSFRMTAGSGDNIIRVLVAYLDDDNYLYAEFGRPASGCTYLQLGERVSGTDNPLGDPVALTAITLTSTFYQVTVCYFADEGVLQASTTMGGSNIIGMRQAASALGDKAGFEIIDGDCSFDGYTFAHAATATERLTCPTCNSGCQIENMSLTGAVDTCLWTSVAGSWASGYVPTGDSILRYNRPHPTGKTHMRVKVSAGGVHANEKVQGIVNYLDDENFHYGEIEYTSSTNLRTTVYKRTGGVDTILDQRDNSVSSASFPVSLNLSVCFDGTRIGASGSFSDASTNAASATTTEHSGGVYAGIGSNGGVDFSLFEFHKHLSSAHPVDASCPVCPKICACDGLSVPYEGYVVDLGAGGWTDDFCDYCDTVSGEYVLGSFLDNACGVTYREVEVCEVDPSDCANCSPDMVFDVRLALEEVSSGVLRWRVIVQLFIFPDLNPLCEEPCDDGKQVIYYSPTFGSSDCRSMPVTLTKSSETGTYPCGGSLPNTITLDAT